MERWPCESAVMAQDVCVLVNVDDRARLAAITGDRSVVSDQSSASFGVARVRLWLQTDIQLPEIEVCLTSISGPK